MQFNIYSMLHGLTIRAFIKKNINHDSEYWSYGIGAEYIHSSLREYSDKDWELLGADIWQWPHDEVEILAISLAFDDRHLQGSDRMLQQRFNLFLRIFERFEPAEAYDLLDDVLEFLAVDELDVGMESLQRIQVQFDEIKSLFKDEIQSIWFTKIQDKINQRMKA